MTQTFPMSIAINLSQASSTHLTLTDVQNWLVLSPLLAPHKSNADCTEVPNSDEVPDSFRNFHQQRVDRARDSRNLHDVEINGLGEIFARKYSEDQNVILTIVQPPSLDPRCLVSQTAANLKTFCRARVSV